MRTSLIVVGLLLGCRPPRLSRADVTIAAAHSGSSIGYTLAAVDIDGDGVDDLVIDNQVFLAPLASGTDEDERDMVLPGEGVGGFSDLGGDGIPDLLLGSSTIVHGPFVRDGLPSWSERTIFENTQALHRVGDLTGDGVDDLVGATWLGGGNVRPSGLRLYAGPFAEGEVAHAAAVATFDSGFDTPGSSLCAVQPGVLLVGAGDSDLGPNLLTLTGPWEGTSSFDDSPPLHLEIPEDVSGEGLSSLFACPGDLDEDGWGDIFLATHGWFAGVLHIEGAHGQLATTVTPLRQFGGLTAFAWGDLDDDGETDLAWGNPSASYGANSRLLATGDFDAGEVAVFGDPGTAPHRIFQVSGDDEWDMLGTALAVGDLNGDGVDDLAMSAPAEAAWALEAPRVAVFFGPL